MESKEPTSSLAHDASTGGPSGRSPPERQPNQAFTGRDGSHESEASSSTRVAHTLTACARCRKRKTRCDVGLPKCRTCEKAAAPCNYWDAARGTEVSRSWVVHLQGKVRGLEAELAQLSDEQTTMPDAANIVREAGLVRVEDSLEPRFLGPSSGIAMSRLVLELAKQSSGTKNIRGILPTSRTRQAKIAPSTTDDSPNAYPIHSNVEAIELLSFEVADKLVEVYCQTAQYMLPTLHEPTFRQDVHDIYNGSTDPYKHFVFKIVIAISMQKLHVRFVGLADSWYLAAMRHFEAVVRPMDLRALQCFILVAQYSVLTPTRTSLYYIAGLATDLCLRLGLHRDDLPIQENGTMSMSPLERDMRCRLFWVVTSIEFGISHTLGRPSAFSIPPDRINRQFFEQVDDRFITNERIFDGPRSLKKVLSIHFFKMRLLQAEIKIKLYQQKDEDLDDSDPWFKTMEAKLEKWRLESPQNDEGSGLTSTWFMGKYNGMIIFLYRPSPQIPHPSVGAALNCYDACTFNVRMSGNQVDNGSVDITWVFIQTLFMSLNTLLWVVSYPEVRRVHTKQHVEKHLEIALNCLDGCSERWPDVKAALDLYQRLTVVSLHVYDGDIGSKDEPLPTIPKTSPVSVESSNASPYPSPPVAEGPPTLSLPQSFDTGTSSLRAQPVQDKMESHSLSIPQAVTGGSSSFNSQPDIAKAAFDPYSVYNTFPETLGSPFSWDVMYASSPALTVLSDGTTLNMNDSFFTAMTDEPHMRSGYGQQQVFDPSQQGGLNQEQHMELTNSLEETGLVDLLNILQQSASFFGNGNGA